MGSKLGRLKSFLHKIDNVMSKRSKVYFIMQGYKKYGITRSPVSLVKPNWRHMLYPDNCLSLDTWSLFATADKWMGVDRSVGSTSVI